jgi:hypothetical protein
MHGEPMPGWRFANSPSFDGGKDDRAMDTVCFELFRPKLPNEPQPPANPPGLVRILQRQKGVIQGTKVLRSYQTVWPSGGRFK